MTQGIYCYIDKKTNKVIYIGRDGDIHKNKRHQDHFKKCNYNKQPINRILQNNPNQYTYKILKEGIFSNYILNELEKMYIKHYNTFRPYTNQGFNFTKGGEGVLGFKHSPETIKKMSITNKRICTKETKERLRKLNENKILSKNQKIKISQARNTTGFFRVDKHKNTYRYRYTTNKKRKSISSVDIKKLEKKVKEKGLPWIKFN